MLEFFIFPVFSTGRVADWHRPVLSLPATHSVWDRTADETSLILDLGTVR